MVRFQVGLQWRGNLYAAIRLLVRFYQRDEQSRQRRAASVQDVRKFVFAVPVLKRRFIRRAWKSSQLDTLETSR